MGWGNRCTNGWAYADRPPPYDLPQHYSVAQTPGGYIWGLARTFCGIFGQKKRAHPICAFKKTMFLSSEASQAEAQRFNNCLPLTACPGRSQKIQESPPCCWAFLGRGWCCQGWGVVARIPKLDGRGRVTFGESLSTPPPLQLKATARTT